MQQQRDHSRAQLRPSERSSGISGQRPGSTGPTPPLGGGAPDDCSYNAGDGAAARHVDTTQRNTDSIANEYASAGPVRSNPADRYHSAHADGQIDGDNTHADGSADERSARAGPYANRQSPRNAGATTWHSRTTAATSANRGASARNTNR